MEKLLKLSLFVIFVSIALVSLGGCDCGGGDDDDDDDLLGGDDDVNVDCVDACDGAFECGAAFWYEDKDQCVEYCGDWAETSVDCADCFFNCFDGAKSCASSLACIYACGEGPCLEDLAELDDSLS